MDDHIARKYDRDDERQGGLVAVALAAIGGFAMWLVLLWLVLPSVWRVVQWGGHIVAGWL